MIAVNLSTRLVIAHSLLQQRNELLHRRDRQIPIFAKGQRQQRIVKLRRNARFPQRLYAPRVALILRENGGYRVELGFR